MHWQKPPHQEVKIVRCVHGAVLDVIVDIRPQSRTYKQWFAAELTEENCKTLYVPKGFAHGYLTLRDQSEVLYLVSEFYDAGSEAGLRWNDESIGIRWPADVPIVQMTDKDRNWPDFAG
jgi:dTDP-4-dehydrorhamnose 3,5-epimerase